MKKSCRRSCPVEANFNSCFLDHQISENAKEGDNVTDKTRVNSGTVTERRILKVTSKSPVFCLTANSIQWSKCHVFDHLRGLKHSHNTTATAIRKICLFVF